MSNSSESRRYAAMSYFEEGYNCSQAVVLAFYDLCGIDKEALLKLASSFGGGMGRMREVCGAVSGMFIAAGCIYGFADTGADGKKAEHYARIQELAGKFKAKNGSYICRELLGLPMGNDSPVPTPRTPEFYKKRPCKELVGDAAEVLCEYINSHQIK